ncbi:MAG TPA: hypothetical protein VLT36_09635 [Candidatus Dormibacteraeota bacterium]|nr:hypothetical protein [Candidatus Dormibacteraeota bacterium]
MGKGLDGIGGIGGWFGDGGIAADAEHAFGDEAVNVAARLFGIAIGKELLLNVGTLGPGPEELFEVLLGTGFLDGEPFLFDGEALRAQVAATEGGEILAEVEEFMIYELMIYDWGKRARA